MEGSRNGAGGQVLLIDGLRTKAARRRKTKLGALGGRGSAHFQRGQQMMWQLANWSRRKKLESDLDRNCTTISTGELSILRGLVFQLRKLVGKPCLNSG